MSYTIITNVNGQGTILKDPIQTTYNNGDTVTLTANQETDWNFISWSGDINSTDNPVTITINGDMDITANFQYQLQEEGVGYKFELIQGPGQIEYDQYKWKTDYNDQGTYDPVIIRQTDLSSGLYSDNEFKIIVNDINRYPTNEFLFFEVEEEKTLYVNLNNYFKDLDMDSITYNKLSGVGTLSSNLFEYTPQIGNKGSKEMEFQVSDNKINLRKKIYINVIEKNLFPNVISNIPDQAILSNEKLEIDLFKKLNDPNNDKITFKLVNGIGDIYGYKFKLKQTDNLLYINDRYLQERIFRQDIDISDGNNTIRLSFNLTVNLRLMRPEIEIPQQTVNQGDNLDIDLLDPSYLYQPNGTSVLNFEILEGVGNINQSNHFIYNPDFSEVGIKVSKLKVYNQEYETVFTILTEVLKVNREPELIINDQNINEGDSLVIDLQDIQNDPDGDRIIFKLNAGPGMIVSDKYIYDNKPGDTNPKSVQIEYTDGNSSITKYESFNIQITPNPQVIDFKFPDVFYIKQNYLLEIDLMKFIINNNYVSDINLISGPGNIINKIYEYTPDFNDQNLGNHIITIELIGVFGTKTQQFNIEVIENNTLPHINIPNQTIIESELDDNGIFIDKQEVLINLSTLQTDQDNDNLIFNVISGPGNIVEDTSSTPTEYYYNYISNGHDHGNKIITIEIDDGRYKVKDQFIITVEQRKQKIRFNPPDFEMYQGESLTINLRDYTYGTDPSNTLIFDKVFGEGTLNNHLYTFEPKYSKLGNNYTLIEAENADNEVVIEFNIIVKKRENNPDITRIYQDKEYLIIEWKQINIPNIKYDVYMKKETDVNFNKIQNDLEDTTLSYKGLYGKPSQNYEFYIEQKYSGNVIEGKHEIYKYKPSTIIDINNLNINEDNIDTNKNFFKPDWD